MVRLPVTSMAREKRPSSESMYFVRMQERTSCWVEDVVGGRQWPPTQW